MNRSRCSHGPVGRLLGMKKNAWADRPQAGGYREKPNEGCVSIFRIDRTVLCYDTSKVFATRRAASTEEILPLIYSCSL